jgi:formylglycine-generating enzyme required for sulfatase activity
MALVRGGTFKMGTDDPAADEDARPAHEVSVADFYMDLYEVTNDEYGRFCKQERHPTPPHWKDGLFPSGEGNMPVTNVSWQDAKRFAEWAGKRLPTEAEWEYAARGPESKNYPWGNEWSERLSNSKELGRNSPQSVGSYQGGVSPFGVFDMAGNVAEWVADDYAPYEGSKAKPDPGNKVYKGGSFKYSKEDQMVWKRYWDAPVAKYPELGFRCAKDVPR